jgi:ABC-2 type transport system permease protein
MTVTPVPAERPSGVGRPATVARPAGVWRDLASVARRALRLVARDPETVIPAVVIPVFFFTVNVGALQSFAEQGIPGLDFKAFQLPVAIIFAVTGISRAPSLVLDIQNGYFDRLLLTPVRRLTLLLGLMVADFVLIIALTIPVLLLGLVLGVDVATGVLGMLAFCLLSGLWGLAFAGFPYAIALRTGNPAAVNTSFLLFFPFAFLTTSFLPAEALTGWLRTVSAWNPVTYLLEGLRALLLEGWDGAAIGKAMLAIVGVGVVAHGLAFAALVGRVRRNG